MMHLTDIAHTIIGDLPMWAVILICTAGVSAWFALGLWAGVNIIRNLLRRN